PPGSSRTIVDRTTGQGAAQTPAVAVCGVSAHPWNTPELRQMNDASYFFAIVSEFGALEICNHRFLQLFFGTRGWHGRCVSLCRAPYAPNPEVYAARAGVGWGSPSRVSCTATRAAAHRRDPRVDLHPGFRPNRLSPHAGALRLGG